MEVEDGRVLVAECEVALGFMLDSASDVAFDLVLGVCFVVVFEPMPEESVLLGADGVQNTPERELGEVALSFNLVLLPRESLFGASMTMASPVLLVESVLFETAV